MAFIEALGSCRADRAGDYSQVGKSVTLTARQCECLQPPWITRQIASWSLTALRSKTQENATFLELRWPTPLEPLGEVLGGLVIAEMWKFLLRGLGILSCFRTLLIAENALVG